jgi:predicted ATPase
MAYPDSWIYHLGDQGLARVDYDDLEHVQVTRAFLASPTRMMRHLFDDG